MEADLYPPDVVMLCPSRVSRAEDTLSCETHSPLSSTATSPRGSPTRQFMMMMGGDDDDDDDSDDSNTDEEPKQQNEQEAQDEEANLPLPLKKKPSIAPFDECLVVDNNFDAAAVTRDEKKTDESSLDNYRMIAPTFSSYQQQNDKDGDNDAGEPPSLALPVEEPPSLALPVEEPPSLALNVPEMAYKKKTTSSTDDDADEVMLVPKLKNGVETDDHDADAGQPPSLSIIPQAQMIMKGIKKPTMVRQRATTTGGIRLRNGANHDDITQKYLNHNLSNAVQQHQQTNHIRKFSVDSQQKIKFAALKRDIVSTASNDNGELHEASFITTTNNATMAPLPPVFAVTPDQQLTSPPTIVKKQIWNSDPALDNYADGNEMTLDHKRLRNIASPIRQSSYCHSSDNDSRYPSFYDTSYETVETGDEAIQENQPSLSSTPRTNMMSSNRNDITPLDHQRTTSDTSLDSGDIPLPTTSSHIKSRPTDMPNAIDSSSDNAYDDHRHGKPMMYSEEEMADLVLRRSAGSIPKVHTSYNHIGHIPLNMDDTTSSILEDEDQVPDDEKQHDVSDDAIKSPFHPQGSIRLPRGRSESTSNDIHACDETEQPAGQTDELVEPDDEGRKKKDLNVSSLFASVVSDAASALTNAAVISDGACFAPKQDASYLEPTTESFLYDAGGGSSSGKSRKSRRSLEKQTTKASQSQKLALTDAMRKTDIPLRRRSVSSDVALRTDTVPSESDDWVKYLKDKGVDPKSRNATQSSKLFLDWINDENNSKGAIKMEGEEGDTNCAVGSEPVATSAIAKVERSEHSSAEGTKTSHLRRTTKKMDPKTSNEKSDAWVQEVEAKLGLKKESSSLSSVRHSTVASSNTTQNATANGSQHDAQTSSSKWGQQASEKSAAWLQKVEAQLGLTSVVDKSPKDEVTTQSYTSFTPKKDLQTSDKSAAWLKEEFRRRTTIKLEINDDILDRNVETPTTAAKHQFANELAKKLEELQNDDSQSAATNADHFSVTDDEVAALTKKKDESAMAIVDAAARANKNRSESHVRHSAEEDFKPVSHKLNTNDKPLARRLEFHGDELEYRERPKSAADIKAPAHLSVSSWQSQQPRLSRSNQDGEAGRMDPVGRATDHQPWDAEMAGDNLDISLQANMRRFVSSTRAALRNDLPGRKSADPYTHSESNLKYPHSPFRSLAVTSPDSDDADVKITYPVQSLTDNTAGSRKTAIHGSLSHRSVSDCGSKASDYSDMQSATPALIQSMDCVYGIAKGDITLSLLNENTGQTEHSPKATWANRVDGAIWRCRRMRRRMGGFGVREAGAPSGRSSVPVDTNKSRAAGGLKSVASTQDTALNHLRFDEIDQAIELFQDIIFAYYSYFERTLKARELNPGLRDEASGTTDFKPYIGIALHNLGILHLLNGQYPDALSFFVRAVDNRKVCLGEGHRDHVVSLSKLAICHYALDEFGEAHSRLEEALKYASRSIQTLEDRVQVAEILNNLGCLAYMCGQPVSANAFFRDSLDVHFRNLSESLYAPTPALGQSISLNISISRANIGFVGLVTRDSQLSITALENALMEQQILLHGANDGANETLMATMDHLAVANLLNGDQEKAAMMFERILVMQQNEYGRQDRRYFVTLDKLKMVQSQGQQFEMAVEKLRRTFTMPQMVHTTMEHTPEKAPPVEMGRHFKATLDRSQSVPAMKVKGHKGGLMGVFNSIRKKKT